MFIHQNTDVYKHIYKCIYNKTSIYTIAETTEPASIIYWINLQVEPKPIYIYIYIYICIWIYIQVYIYTCIQISL